MRVKAAMKWVLWSGLAVSTWASTAQAAEPLSGPPGPLKARDPEDPAITRDGKQVAFAVRSLGMDWKVKGVDLWLVSGDGSGLHQITGGALDTHPSFSPDGRQIVFLRKTDLNDSTQDKTDVYVFNLADNTIRQLTTSPQTEYEPIFAPDGRAVLFVRQQKTFFEEGELVKLDLATGQEQVLIDAKYGVTQVAPSPLETGSYLATTARLGPNGEPLPPQAEVFDDKALVTFKADGGSLRTVYAPAVGNSLPRFIVSDSKIYMQISRFIASNLFELAGEEAKAVGIEEIKFAHDLSADGNFFVGAGFVDKNLNKGIWLYNLATREYKILQRAAKPDDAPATETPVTKTPETAPTTPQATAPQATAPQATTPVEPSRKPDPRWEKAKMLVSQGDKQNQSGNYGEAIKQYDAALALDDENFMGHFGRGLAYDRQGKTTEALRDYSRAIDLFPEYYEAFTNRGAIFVQLKRDDEALQDYNAALKVFPTYWAAHYNRGLLLLRRGDQQGALADFNAAIEDRPAFDNAYLTRGNLLLDLNRRNESLADFNRYIEKQPGDWRGYARRGEWYAKSTTAADMKKGIADLDNAIALHPNDYKLVNLRAALHARSGDHAKAIADYTQSIRAKYDLAVSLRRRAAAYRKIGKPALATADEKAAATLKTGA